MVCRDAVYYIVRDTVDVARFLFPGLDILRQIYMLSKYVVFAI